MKFNIWSIGLIGLIGITPPLCSAETSTNKTSIKEVRQEAQVLLQRLDAYTADQKDEAICKTKTALAELDKRIDALETRINENWDNMDKDARKKARDSLKASSKQRNQVAEWYARLQSSTENAWEHMKKGFANAYKTLHNSLGKSENEFGSNK